MIGQNVLKTQIDTLIESGFPRFIILTGIKGQGKKYIANYIANKLNFTLIKVEDLKIDTMRAVIENAYKQTEPIIYLIPDADRMSLGAKNSLLKLLEEPPNQSYFILTLQQIENTLDTIKSRCIALEMDRYNFNELDEFINELSPNLTNSEKALLKQCCNNRYELNLFINYGISDFYNFVNKVVNNIWKVQSANSFKIAENLDLKDDGNGYDLILFLKTFNRICISNMVDLVTDNESEDTFFNYGESISKTIDILNKININGINKQSLLDMWILDIRKIWRS